MLEQIDQLCKELNIPPFDKEEYAAMLESGKHQKNKDKYDMSKNII